MKYILLLLVLVSCKDEITQVIQPEESFKIQVYFDSTDFNYYAKSNDSYYLIWYRSKSFYNDYYLYWEDVDSTIKAKIPFLFYARPDQTVDFFITYNDSTFLYKTYTNP